MRKDFAPGFGAGWDAGGEEVKGAAVVKPAYLWVSHEGKG
jgi:hypothetical protein